MESVKGKVALITGASSGIGAATAILFAKYGSLLVLTGRNEENLHKTAEHCRAAGLDDKKIKIVTGDVTKDSDLDNVVEVAATTFGTIDILVNNAAGGFGKLGGTQALSMTDFDLTYRTCLRAVVYVTKLAIPYIKKCKGTIVNVSSISGIRAGQDTTAYSMMKAALDMFTKDLALELASSGVRVNSVNPGYIRTPVHEWRKSGGELEQILEDLGKQHPIPRMGKAEEVAMAILFLASDASSFTTGTVLMVDGGIIQTSSWTKRN